MNTTNKNTPPNLSEMIARVREEVGKLPMNQAAIALQLRQLREIAPQLADTLSALLEREAGLRKLIDDAEHNYGCAMRASARRGTELLPCNCFKSRALALSTTPPIKPENTHDQP